MEGNKKIHITKGYLSRHCKYIHTHIQKHHKKYIFGSILYGLFHLAFFDRIGLKLFFVKFFIFLLIIFGFYNYTVIGTFAKMDNICVNNHSTIALQSCDKNFNTIQEAVNYVESSIDPEIDTIYNAEYYDLILSVLSNYCGEYINYSDLVKQKIIFMYVNKIPNSLRKLQVLKGLYANQKKLSYIASTLPHPDFCRKKYFSYSTLKYAKNAYLSELEKLKLLTYYPIEDTYSFKSSIFTLGFFAKWGYDVDKVGYDFAYSGGNMMKTTSNKILSNIIKNITLSGINSTVDELYKNNLIGAIDQKELKDKISVDFLLSCDKVRGHHTILQYYNKDDILQRIDLKELKIKVPLCNSFQYIDQLYTHIQRIVSHEIGHYIYYIKDDNTDNFNKICWNNKNKICNNSSFVTKYSQTNSEEDYAETFSRWFLSKVSTAPEYLGYHDRILPLSEIDSPQNTHVDEDGFFVHGSAGLEKQSFIKNKLGEKFEYFENLKQHLH